MSLTLAERVGAIAPSATLAMAGAAKRLKAMGNPKYQVDGDRGPAVRASVYRCTPRHLTCRTAGGAGGFAMSGRILSPIAKSALGRSRRPAPALPFPLPASNTRRQ